MNLQGTSNDRRGLSNSQRYWQNHVESILAKWGIYALDLLQWRHNERDGVSTHRRLDCLFNRRSGADQRKYQSSASLVFAWESSSHRWPVNSPHKRPVTRKMFPFDDVIMFMNVPPVTLSRFYMGDFEIYYRKPYTNHVVVAKQLIYIHYL